MPDLEDRVAALEAIVAQLAPEPEFMAQVRVDTFRDTGVRAVRLTHLPTGVSVDAPTRPEAVAKLGRALEARAERHASFAS